METRRKAIVRPGTHEKKRPKIVANDELITNSTTPEICISDFSLSFLPQRNKTSNEDISWESHRKMPFKFLMLRVGRLIRQFRTMARKL